MKHFWEHNYYLNTFYCSYGLNSETAVQAGEHSRDRESEANEYSRLLPQFFKKNSCKNLLINAKKKNESIKKQLNLVLSLKRDALEKKKISELRTIVESIGGVDIETLKEKGDFIQIILDTQKKRNSSKQKIKNDAIRLT